MTSGTSSGKGPEYPLEQVLAVKKQRVDEAEAAVRVRKKELEKEEEKLKKAEEKRDKVLKHKEDKLAQLREALDTGTTSDEVDRMKKYLEVVKEDLAAEEEKVKEQQSQVDLAEKNLEAAKLLLKQRRLELDKMEIHKAEWWRVMRKELRIAEEKEQDELGQATYLARRAEERRRKK